MYNNVKEWLSSSEDIFLPKFYFYSGRKTHSIPNILERKSIGYITFRELETPVAVFYTRQDGSTKIIVQKSCVSSFLCLNFESK